MEAHGALNADWAYPSFPNDTDGVLSSRGHRTAIMSAQAGFLSNAGFAMVPELKPNTEVGELVFSGIYAAAEPTAANHYNRFLTGTVWADANRNNRYDPGEGINNVRVQPDRGTFHAITGAGGGWAIPVSAQTYQLTFSGGSLSATFLRTATVTADWSISLTVMYGMRLYSPGWLRFHFSAETASRASSFHEVTDQTSAATP